MLIKYNASKSKFWRQIVMKKVLVIGGGYGGLRTIETLAKYKDIDITLIDQNPYHYLQTEAYGYIAGQFDVHEVAIDLKNWCEGFKGKVAFIHEEVSAVNFEDKCVNLNGKDLSYNFLVIATGAKTHFFSFIKGLRENSYGVKTLQKAHGFKVEFERLIYNKLRYEQDHKEGELNIAIGGAGLSGVEVAAEMAYVLETYSKTIGDTVKEIHIYLIDASDTILPGMGKYSIEKTKKRLESLGVKIMTGAFIKSVDASNIYFENGEKLPYHFMIFTGGIKASELNDTIENEKNSINQLITTQELNIKGQKDVFAIGDCVEIKDREGNILPPTAQIAEKSAEYVAKTIRQRIDGVQSQAFDADVQGIFIALGGKYAVGEMFKYIKVQGYVAYLLKKAITHAYYLGLRLRINTGFKNRIRKQ